VTSPDADLHREVYGKSSGRDLLGLLRTGGLRAVGRLAAISTWTAVCLIVLVSGHGVLIVAPRQRRPWRHRVVRRWARGLGWLVGMRVEIHGEPPVAPFFLVANHLSYVDIVLLLGLLDTVFVAKRELVDWPVIGYLARITGTIFVDRRRARDAVRVLDSIDERIADGEGVVLVPEGTSSGGDDVYPLRPALFEWAVRSGYPVRAATIGYRSPPGGPPASEAICWWGDMSFLPHLIRLCGLPGFDAQVRFAGDPVVGTNRTDLARRARDVISSGLVDGPRREGA
jgi:1-acyl-sn-glycerol-3-phosphate acyltransferase